MEYEDRSDELSSEASELEEQSDELERDISDVRSDWESKKSDASIPGATEDPEPESGDDEGGVASGSAGPEAE